MTDAVTVTDEMVEAGREAVAHRIATDSGKKYFIDAEHFRSIIEAALATQPHDQRIAELEAENARLVKSLGEAHEQITVLEAEDTCSEEELRGYEDDLLNVTKERNELLAREEQLREALNELGHWLSYAGDQHGKVEKKPLQERIDAALSLTPPQALSKRDGEKPLYEDLGEGRTGTISPDEAEISTLKHKLTNALEELEQEVVDGEFLKLRLATRDGEVLALREALKPFAEYGEVLKGQRTDKSRVMLELWDHRITGDDLVAAHEVTMGTIEAVSKAAHQEWKRGYETGFKDGQSQALTSTQAAQDAEDAIRADERERCANIELDIEIDMADPRTAFSQTVAAYKRAIRSLSTKGDG